MFQELNMPFSIDELLKATKQLNKSGSPDMYLNEFFIHGKNVILPNLLVLFNKIFKLGYFPDSWFEGYIVPLHKRVASMKLIITEALPY